MLTVAIQAGGESRRMGQDKALVPFLGQPLVARVMARLSTVSDEIIVTTNNTQALRFLGVPLFADLIPGRGALGGLYTAVSAASQPLVAVVACDMPFASPELIAALRDALWQSEADIAIPQLPDGMQPFHAVYRRATCLPHIRQAIQSDRWRADAWFDKVHIRYFSAHEVQQYDPNLLCFANVNTPEELSAAEQLALQQG
jgi:molybdopterin-guanine dinucleotide biosynthesis protein A